MAKNEIIKMLGSYNVTEGKAKKPNAASFRRFLLAIEINSLKADVRDLTEAIDQLKRVCKRNDYRLNYRELNKALLDTRKRSESIARGWESM